MSYAKAQKNCQRLSDYVSNSNNLLLPTPEIWGNSKQSRNRMFRFIDLTISAASYDYEKDEVQQICAILAKAISDNPSLMQRIYDNS